MHADLAHQLTERQSVFGTFKLGTFVDAVASPIVDEWPRRGYSDLKRAGGPDAYDNVVKELLDSVMNRIARPPAREIDLASTSIGSCTFSAWTLRLFGAGEFTASANL